MVAPPEALRIAINKQRFLFLVNVDAAATWAVSSPLWLQLFILWQFSIVELCENVSVIGAVEITTDQSDLLALVWIGAGWAQSNLDVLKDSIFVKVHRLDKLS